MNSIFLPFIKAEDIDNAKGSGNPEDLYDLMAQPLHEWLYQQGSFDHIDQLSQGQQLLLTYDYLRMQVGQGGFIQFIQNGYVGLLPDLIEQLYMVKANDMAKVLDDVLKVYVLNRDLLNKETSVEEFAKLYAELKEFEQIEDRFNSFNPQAITLILEYTLEHLTEFIAS